MDLMLQFEGIEKKFFGVHALKDVTLSVAAGHTLGLVGENGAGKSTLMNILGGNLQPDAGSMQLAGKPYAPRNPGDAAAAGVAFIHQELNLFGNLSIAENIFITSFPRLGRGLPLIDRHAIRRQTRELLEMVDLPLSPDLPVDRLSPGERQLVEIAKALSIEARIILFDEPTTSLTARETERLFALIERLQEGGISMIYISHTLGHVMRLCHDIVVLRDGEVVGQGPASEFPIDRMISLMVGRSISQLFPEREGIPSSKPVLEVRSVSQPGVVEDISFTLHRGEILGISGLMGSGRSELARILFGVDRFARGEIVLEGQPFRPSPRHSIRRGLAFLTEDRREEGLLMEAAVLDNMALVALPAHVTSTLKLVNPSLLHRAVVGIRKAVRLAPSARDEQPVKTLSGGNQQKVVLAKWLLDRPTVLILDEPTRGIDVGAKTEIYQLIIDLANQGAGVLVISSEIEELVGLCDRILVMRKGEIRDQLEREQFDRERVLRSALMTSTV